jgi:inner membrane protein
MALHTHSALVKAAMLTALALLLLLPLAMLGQLVAERDGMRSAAVQAVARGWGGQQWVSGPILAIPVTTAGRALTRDWYVLPETLELTADLQVQESRRKLGVYEVPVYAARIHAHAEFDVSRQIQRLTRGSASYNVHLEQARILLPVDDPRGVRGVTIDPSVLQGEFEPATGFPVPVLAALPLAGTDWLSGRRAVDLTFDVAGTQSLGFLPFGRTVRVHAQGNWPDPGFTAGFLPLQRTINAQGFTAQWQVFNVNRTYGDHWLEGDTARNTVLESAFGIELVQPVDIYQRSTRAVKYGGLFIALSFLSLFLWERLQSRPLHPIQYGLMGLSLSVFYLLLLALSEQIGFLGAYVLASAALCTLMGVYLAGSLASNRAGAGAAGIFGGVYALLYLLVSSESYALLAGSLALFAVLAVIMILTRKLDWYQER